MSDNWLSLSPCLKTRKAFYKPLKQRLWKSMFVIYAVGCMTLPWEYPKRALRPEPRGRKSPPISNARCAVSARTSSRKSRRCPFFCMRKGYFGDAAKKLETRHWWFCQSLIRISIFGYVCPFSLLLLKENRRKEMRFAAARFFPKIGRFSLKRENLHRSLRSRCFGQFAFLHAQNDTIS